MYDPSTDRVYITTANGNFNANLGGRNWGDSVLSLHAVGTGDNLGNPLDSYTPPDYADLDRFDLDFGSGAVAILPAPPTSRYSHLGTVVGKDSLLRFLNLQDMSGSHGPRFVGGELQTATTRDVEDIGTPQGAVWVDTHGDGATWFFQPQYSSNLQALKLIVDVSGSPSLTNKWSNGQGLISPIIANDVLYAAISSDQVAAYSWTSELIFQHIDLSRFN